MSAEGFWHDFSFFLCNLCNTVKKSIPLLQDILNTIGHGFTEITAKVLKVFSEFISNFI